MKVLVLVLGLVALNRWRRSRFDLSDRTHGYGRYADVAPVRR